MSDPLAGFPFLDADMEEQFVVTAVSNRVVDDGVVPSCPRFPGSRIVTVYMRGLVILITHFESGFGANVRDKGGALKRRLIRQLQVLSRFHEHSREHFVHVLAACFSMCDGDDDCSKEELVRLQGGSVAG